MTFTASVFSRCRKRRQETSQSSADRLFGESLFPPDHQLHHRHRLQWVSHQPAQRSGFMFQLNRRNCSWRGNDEFVSELVSVNRIESSYQDWAQENTGLWFCRVLSASLSWPSGFCLHLCHDLHSRDESPPLPSMKLWFRTTQVVLGKVSSRSGVQVSGRFVQ